MESESTSPLEITGVVKKATKDYKICPNRIWAIAKYFADKEKILPSIIPPTEKIRQAVDLQAQGLFYRHDQCTFDLCEYSRRDFTSVQQRHEQSSCKSTPCIPLGDWFPRAVLEHAVNGGKPTAWRLNGKSTIESPERFMAVSHVWSDGTGAGAWPDGVVNKCLYNFFKSIAEQFQCEGIWWDTICIPNEKSARNKAINSIPRNFEDARVTLVHDDFLRNWEWVDAEIACFAIIVSPWFSRGWTALELARSRKVKVLFKGKTHPVVKDLDEDILPKANDPSISLLHRLAAEVIANLRRREITNINELLTVLGSRYTSWPRDVAVISALLVGIDIPRDASEQEIYQKILLRMAHVSHGHLFHDSAIMSGGFCWCPTSLFMMSPCFSSKSLQINEIGEVTGYWKIFNLNSFSQECYIWKGIHPLIKARLDVARAPLNKASHVLLVEPDARQIVRGLLVQAIRTKEETLGIVRCQYVGAVYFHPPQQISPDIVHWRRAEVKIGSFEGTEPHQDAFNSVGEIINTGQECSRCQNSAKFKISTSNVQNSSDFVMTAEKEVELLLATANGDEKTVDTLLQECAHPDFRDETTWTPLHHACWRGYSRIVQKLVAAGADQNIPDRLGQLPLHLAAERGNESIVKMLLEETNINFRSRHDGQNSLDRAVWGGSKAVVGLLLQKFDPSLFVQDKITALEIAKQKADTSIINLLQKNNQPSAQSSGVQKLATQIKHEGAAEPRSWEKGSKDTSLIHLAGTGDILKVKKLLEAQADLEMKYRNGQTALSWAARNGHREVVKLLLQEGAKLESKDKYGLTALLWAARNGHKLTVELLLDKNADLQSRDYLYKETALSWAETYDHKSVADVLTRKAHDLGLQPLAGDITDNWTDGSDQTSLIWAAAHGRKTLVRLLLEKRPYLEYKDVFSQTALTWAAKNGHEAVVHLLLEEGANIECEGHFRQTSLVQAAEQGHEAVVLLLVKKGARLDSKDSNGRTPLSNAVAHGHVAVVQLLLEEGADLESECNGGQTALSWAASCGYTAVIQLLIEKGARIESKDKYRRTPLSWAVATKHTDSMLLLLEKGADLETKDEYSRTPLASAAADGDELVRLLLDKGADLETKDEYSRTPLSSAAADGNEELVRLLLDKGAELDSNDKMSCSPLWYAVLKNRDRIVRLLLEKGADLEFKDRDGQTPLWLAAANGYKELVELLLEKGAKLQSNDNYGQTLLEWTADTGNDKIVPILEAHLRKGTARQNR